MASWCSCHCRVNIDERLVVERVRAGKDVDGFHPENVGLLASGNPRFVPCTPLGIRELLRSASVATRGRARGGARPVELGRQADGDAALAEGARR